MTSMTVEIEPFIEPIEQSDSMDGEYSEASDGAEVDENSSQGSRRLLADGDGNLPGNNGRRWSRQEDQQLKQLIMQHGENYELIALNFKDRSEAQCQQRWTKVVNPELVKGPWTAEEDNKVIELVKRYGPKKWTLIASKENILGFQKGELH
uniref:HTH myb-type domain-containing protein n=1 Tax=Megaselia scalaris TaxID=36166 RepID=T1GJ98_MEGSC